MQLNWDDIRVFLEIERTGRMSQAAKRLGVSHTTIARRLKMMEERCGCSLFQPTDTGLALTEIGAQILSHAHEMEGAAGAITDRLIRQNSDTTSRVRVGAPDGFGNAILSHILPEFLRKHPEFEIELVPLPVNHKLWRRDVDIAVSLDRPVTGRIVMRKLTDYDLNLYASPNFFDPDGPPTAREELRGRPFVGYIDELLYTPELDFNRFILSDIKVVYKAATVKAQFDAVRNGVGLGVLPAFMTRDTELVPVLPEEINFERSYWLLYPEEYKTLARIRCVSDFIFEKTQVMSNLFRFWG